MVRWLVTALAGALGGILAAQAARVGHIPGSFMVQYHDGHEPKTVLDRIRQKHDVQVRQELHFSLFKGADIMFPDAKTARAAAAEVRGMAGVKRIWKSRLYSRPQVTMESIGNGDVEHEAVKHNVEKDTFSPHVMTQVNLLRDAGYVGKGFKVAIIDTGIDYLHPALGGGFGPGFLVSFGRDLVGDDFNGSNTPVPDPDPMDTCDGHGSHVAGIMAAQPDKNPYGIIGAAAGVSLGAYRVFGCGDNVTTSESVLIAAYHSAFDDGAQVIHASIGGDDGWPEDLWSATVATIVAHGVPCTLAQGNAGRAGLFHASSAADAIGAAAVGSVDNVLSPSLQVKATYTVNGGAPLPFGFTPGLPKNWTMQPKPLWTPVTDASNITDQRIGCRPYPDTTPNLSGHIVLMPSGHCNADVKAAHAAQWGAKEVLVYNKYPGTGSVFNLSEIGMPFGLVSDELGAEWVKLLLSGAQVNVTMPDVEKTPLELNNFNFTGYGGHMSTFTSWGPTWELGIKPQFSVPGRNILSTFPRALGSYAVLSGTSMSSPLMAAMYVLLMEKTGIREPTKLGRLFSATAKQLEYRDNGLIQTIVGLPAPVPQQGAGMAQVYDASRARAMFDVESLAFNDTGSPAAERNFTVINLSNETLQYRLQHVPAATAYTFKNDTSLSPASETRKDSPPFNTVPNELVDGHATLDFSIPAHNNKATDSPDSFSIPAGQERVVSVRITRPTALDDGRLPVWSGWIQLTNEDDNGSKLSLPYQGVTGRLHDRRVLMLNGTGLAGFNDQELLLAPRTFLLPPAGKSNLTRWELNQDTDRPTVFAKLALGSPLIRADLIPIDVPGAKFNMTTILGTKTAGPLKGYPDFYISPGDYISDFDGQLDDDSYVPEGKYKINIKVLHIFGDPDKREDYDEFETLEFGIRYAFEL